MKKANKAGRKRYILFGIEIALILLVAVSFFFPHREYRFETDMVYSEASDPSGGSKLSDPFALPLGSYRVTVFYSSDADMSNTCDLCSEKLYGGSLATNGAQLFAGYRDISFDVWLYRSTDDLRLVSEYYGPGDFSVEGFQVTENNAFRGMALFGILMASLLVDVIWVCARRNKVRPYSKEDKIIFAGLIVTIFYASYPLFGDYILGGGDLGYHLQRVEGIRDSLLQGFFPVRISPEWQQGYGYASPIFYGETIIFIAGVLRVIGFDVTSTFRIFLFLVSTATVLIAYQSFRGILRERYAALLSAFLYSTGVYRIYKVYYCESWGEMLGILLLPWIIYAFFDIYTADTKEKGYQKKFISLAAGLALLVQSHLLTGEMVGGFTIITCVWLWKRTLEPARFRELAKSAVGAVLLSAWFLVPFADYMLTGNFVIQNVSARTIQYRGLLPAHLLMTFFRNGENVFIDQTGMYETAAMGVGGVLILVLFCFLYMWFFGQREGLSDVEWKASKMMAVYAVLAMVMSLSVFPWDRIQSSGRLAAALVSSIQFPNRFLTIANVMLCILAGVVCKHMLARKDLRKVLLYIGAVAILATGNLYLLEDEMERDEAIRVYNDEGMGTGYISGAEYLPYGADPSKFMPHDPVATGEILLKGYEKKPLGAKVYAQNPGQEEITLSFPLLYYKGYEAENADTGEKLVVRGGDNYEVNVMLPAGFAGTVIVRFAEPFYWRAAEAVTLCSIAFMLWFGLLREVVHEKRKKTVSGK